jgi:hypothetical protein
MEKPTHTPGPWHVANVPDITGPNAGSYEIFNKPYGLGVVAHADSEADAKRIVACVNAMEGIDDPSNLRATWDAIKELELDKYKNLKEAVQSLIQGIDNGMHMKSDSIIVEVLRHAIQ